MHSSKFELVKGFYDEGTWNEARVRNAVKKGWITEAECEEILHGPAEPGPEPEPEQEWAAPLLRSSKSRTK